jgi:signal transduction histidine kinase
VAVLDLQSDLRNAFDESDRLSMETLAHALGTAIQNANSYHALEKINAQLAETARMKDEIVQIVAHDFRSPLTVIRGYMDHLLKKEEWKDERQKEIMETVSYQAIRLQRLAEATLKASRLDSGDISFSYEKVDFQSFLQRLVFPWSEKHTFVQEVEDSLPLIHADAGRLQEVMENLLSNAIKYSPNGGKITITARKAYRSDLPEDLDLPDAGVFLVVSVSDEGIGIPPHKRELLFRRFTRLHEIRRVEGIGLGLYIAKKMIDTHGGRIWLEDRDKGACFSFALPGFEDDTGEDTILVIDDDIHTLRMMHRAVSELGYDVITAAEGQEALEKLMRFHPCLIVVDILMPVMSGDELIRRLKEAAGFSEIPIIVFTGQRDYRTSEEYKSIPVISKNAGIEALLNKIREILD